MKILGIIPARYASTRFPGKPLAVIRGKSMIRRVYEQASACPSLRKVIVATDHHAIEKHVAGFNGHIFMTSKKHKSGTERCWEVVSRLKEAGEQFDVIINIQGDEPYIDPRQITQLCESFNDDAIKIATLAKKITTNKELTDPNVVKVVSDLTQRALYFSRSGIPFSRAKGLSEPTVTSWYFKHIGIYGYRSETLKELVLLKSTPLELSESLEQLRWLEHGYQVFVRETEFESIAVDTPADLLKITNRD